MTPRPRDDHYSYTTYADPETARTFDDRRFGGPIGELVAGMQARAHRSTTRHERRVGVSPTPPLVHPIGNSFMRCAALVSFRQFGVQ